MTARNERERRAEIRARELAKEAGQPEALWELFLFDAYQELELGRKMR